MTLEGVEVSKQEKDGSDFDYMTKREEPYQKPKVVRCNQSQRNIQKLEKGNDKRRRCDKPLPWREGEQRSGPYLAHPGSIVLS